MECSVQRSTTYISRIMKILSNVLFKDVPFIGQGLWEFLQMFC